VKSTTPLRILCAPGLPENRLNMHPNEGADLGFMMTRYSVDLGEGSMVELHLVNECPRESVEVCPKFWERLGRPAKAILSWDGSMLRIEKA
jgi:hypothetical protein